MVKYTKNDLLDILFTQLHHNFYFLSIIEKEIIKDCLDETLHRVEVCFSKINNKYYHIKKREFPLNPFHSGQYLIFLYYLGNMIYKKSNNVELAEKLYYLNKIMHSIDLFYQVEMPDIFFVEHPVGSVIGRADFSNFLTIYQNCSIGGSIINDKIYYPTIGENVTLYSYSCILGKSIVGKNSIIASHAYVKNEIIPDNTIVFGQSPNLILKENRKLVRYFFNN